MQESTLFGRPRWHITLGVVFFAQLMTAMGFSLVFPFLPLYVEDLGSTSGMSVELMAGLVIAVQGFTMMLASPLWGAVADRYGRKPMVLRAMFGGTIIMALMGLVTSGEQLIFLRGVQGLITGTVAANNALVAAAAPRERVGFAMGTLQVGLWGGVALGPIVGGVLADNFGFAMPFFITAIALFISGVLVYIGIDEKFTPVKRKKNEVRVGVLQQWRGILTTDGVQMLYFMRFLASIGRMMIIPIAPLFVVALLPPDSPNQNILAGSLIAVSSATSTFSGVYLGRLGDRIGHRTILIASAVVATIFYVPQFAVVDVWQLIILQGLAGLALGGLASAPSALLARYTQPGNEGAVYGLDNSIVAGARAVAPLIGSIVAVLLGLRGTFAATAMLFFIVTVLAYLFLPQDRLETNHLQPVAVGD